MNAVRRHTLSTAALRGLLQVLAVLALVSQAAAAERIVLDFENVRKPPYPPGGAGGALYTVIKRPHVIEDGFKLRRVKGRARGPSFAYWDPPAPGYTGSVAIQAQLPFNTRTILRPTTPGRIFGLLKLHATNCCGRRNSTMTIRGVKANGSVVKRTIRVPATVELKPFRFSRTWRGLKKVTFNQTDFTQMDDIMLIEEGQ